MEIYSAVKVGIGLLQVANQSTRRIIVSIKPGLFDQKFLFIIKFLIIWTFIFYNIFDFVTYDVLPKIYIKIKKM